MSWLDRINEELVITTGDGKEWKPLWQNSTREYDWNFAEFEFPNLAGTLAKKSQLKGVRYGFELYFQGDDHFEVTTAFMQSAKDLRPWKISHPNYGILYVQVPKIQVDETKYNVSLLTGVAIETILDDKPMAFNDPLTKILTDKSNLDESFITNFQAKPNSSDVNSLKQTNDNFYLLGKSKIKDSVEAEEYFNLYNQSNAALTNAINDPLLAMRQLNAFITYPARTQTDVNARVNLYLEQFNLLRSNITGISTKNEKQIYQNNAGTIFANICVAAATPLTTNYQTKMLVVNMSQLIFTNYKLFLTDLDLLQSDNGGKVESFIPDQSLIQGLDSLINYTLSNLFNIAKDAKQERTVILGEDSNVILLTHRFYGLDQADGNLSNFIEINNISLNEILNIEKGRKLVYYV